MNNTENHYGWISIFIHWIVALTVFGLFGLGYWMVDLGYYDAWYKPAPALHKSIGITLLALMVVRTIWRKNQIKPKPLATHTEIERKSGHAVHIALYFIIFIVMFSGYFISTADGRAIEVFELFEVPGFGALIENQEDVAGLIHQYAAYTLVGIAILHALAALKHHFIDKDNTLKRMLGKPKLN
ncbi:MAG: cytochrome b [Kangiellaceae bacterium]|nr:cytochrome b [Kangiellaceae bacterium]